MDNDQDNQPSPSKQDQISAA